VEKHIYLRKANDDFVSHCKCAKNDALISSPGQADCPWCGCGWLFSCNRCRKAFTFAEGVEVGESWEQTGDRDLRALYQRAAKPGEVGEWVEFMKIFLKEVKPGGLYVYLDGYVIPTTAEEITIEGWHSYHHLNFVPQVVAMHDPSVRTDLLSSREYWQYNRVESE
jgi:hypothetical protein